MVRNFNALRFQFQNRFKDHATVWKEFSRRVFFMLHSMLDQNFLSEFQRIMNECDVLHDKIAYFIEM